jgi:hypothetical protein
MIKMKSTYRLFLVIALLTGLLASCKKDEVEKTPEYIGTWVNQDVSGLYTNNLTVTKTDFSLSKNLVTPIAAIKIVSIAGTQIVNGDKASVSVSEIVIPDTTLNITGSIPTLSYLTYKKGSKEFDSALLKYGYSSQFDVLYSVANNQLTTKTDYNKDGDYTDDGETTVFTKK